MFKSDEDSDPIIIKVGIEIETIEYLSGDEIESISILNPKKLSKSIALRAFTVSSKSLERRKAKAKQSYLIFNNPMHVYFT